MQRIYEYLLRLLRLGKTIRYHNELSSLISMMDELVEGRTYGQPLICEKKSELYYLVRPKEEDAMQINNGLFTVKQETIVHVHIVPEKEHLQQIQCTGKIRPLHLGIFSFYLSLIYFQVFKSDDGLSKNGFIGLTILWIIVHALANYAWSLKEKDVVFDLKKALLIQMKLAKQNQQ
jgi:hypothetical protein